MEEIVSKKVSVIIPNYNNGEYICECLDSIMKQNYKNIEVIVIDDGSSDDSVKLISKYDVKLIKQFNSNGSIARNRGIEISSGDYLLFLDSDDVLNDENTISDMVKDIDGYDLLICDFDCMDKDGNITSHREVSSRFVDRDNKYKYARTFPVLTNKLYSKSIIDKYGIYFSNVRIGQDLNFYLKYLSCIDKINYVNKTSFKYRIHESSLSNKVNLNFLDIYTSMEEVKKFYIKNDKEREFNKYIRGVGIEHFDIESKKVSHFNDKKLINMINTFFDYIIDEYYDLSIYKDSFVIKIYESYKRRRANYFVKKYRGAKRRIENLFNK